MATNPDSDSDGDYGDPDIDGGVNETDDCVIDTLLATQSAHADELSALQSEQIELAIQPIPGYGVARLKPSGPIPIDEDGSKT